MMKPLFTEKSLIEAQKGRFTFKVQKGLNKFQIKNLIEEIFNVHVIDVATLNYKGNTRRTNRGVKVTTTPWKKAIVTLKSGETIELFSQEKKDKPKAAKVKKEKAQK